MKLRKPERVLVSYEQALETWENYEMDVFYKGIDGKWVAIDCYSDFDELGKDAEYSIC